MQIWQALTENHARQNEDNFQCSQEVTSKTVEGVEGFPYCFYYARLRGNKRLNYLHPLRNVR
jgi:hypothetical protein